MQRPVRIVNVIVLAVITLSSAVFVEPALVASSSFPNPTATTSLRSLVAELMKNTTNMTDTDGDTLPDSVEAVIGTDFNNTDSDFDRLSDSYEIEHDLDPLNPDSNNDGLPDYYEVSNVTSSDMDGDGLQNAWDPDNDGDGVNDAVDLSPFARSVVSDSFHLNIQTNGLPTYITFQVRPEQSEYLKLPNRYWDWPFDDKGSMKDLDNSANDVRLFPMLHLTANVIPNQSEVIDYGITTASSGAYVPLYPVDEYGTTVAFTGRMIYPLGPPLNLSLGAEMIWRVLGNSDEKAVALKAVANGKYFSVDSQGRVVASGTGVGEGEKLQVIDLGQSTVAYKAPNGLYMSVAANGIVIANATDIGDRETFTLTKKTGNKITLKAWNGLYLAVSADGTITANAASATYEFESISAGVISESITLATYKEPFMLTGLAVELNYGSQTGLFFSHNRNETIAANLFLSYSFLRNSTTTLLEMPSVLSSHGSQVFSQVSSFSHKDQAFMSMTNEDMPNVLSILQAGAGSQILPVISSLEDHFASLDLSQMVPAFGIVGASWNANLTAEPVVTSKTLKMNLYNTTTCKSLEIDDVVAEVSQWEPDENASLQLISMMTAWNIGEQFVTKVGKVETKFDFFGEYIDIYNKILNFGTGAFSFIRKVVLPGYQAYRLLTEANRIWMASGGHIGGKTFRAMFSAWKTNFKSISSAKTGSMLTFKRISQTLDVIGTLIDLGIAIYSVFSIIDAGLNPMELYSALLLTVMTLAYSLTLTLIGAIPIVGWLISLAISISDLFGKWSEKLFSAIISAMSKVTAQVTPTIKFGGEPSITVIDKDDNGLDVGDRIQYTVRLNASLTSTDSRCLSYSELYPYYIVVNPAGTNSIVGYPYLTEWVFMARDLGQSGNDIHLWLPIPPASLRTYTYGTGWKANEYQVGGWIEPGVAMPNFPVTLKSQTEYELWYKYKIFFFFVFYWFWQEFLGRSAGIKDLGSETLYFDVLPATLSDFVKWKSIKAVDLDFDGLTNKQETASNPLLWDTDGDGLNDKYELDIGTNPKMFDTDQDGLNDRLEQIYGTNPKDPDSDGDGLSDYLEVGGWIAVFYYGGSLFTFHVTSNPLLPDTDSDGLTDNLEYSSRQNPKSKDTDGDGNTDQERDPIPLPDTLIDSDGDGINDAFEKIGWNIVVTNPNGTQTVKVTSDPYLNDTDFDGLTDLQEYDHSSNPRVPDTDGDGVSDFLETQYETNPSSSDTDGDGLDDGFELTFGCNPKKNDTDGDGLLDLDEILLGSNPMKNDTDSDGLGDLQEVLFGSNATLPDSDDDFLFDGQEFSLGTNPLSNDTDSDGLLDGYEVMIGTNPLNNDTDSDGVLDYKEIKLGINPVSNDTDVDGLLDGMELTLGTAPWNSDTDSDGLNDLEDPDTYVPNVKQVVLVSDGDTDTSEFIDNLGLYTNVTVVSAEELLAKYSSSPYIVLMGKPSNESGTVGDLIRGLLQDYGEHLTNETLDTRVAVRYGVWSSKQTVVVLSEPTYADYFRVLSILKSKNATVLQDSVIVNYQVMILPSGNPQNCSLYFLTDEMDMVRATDSVVGVGLEQSARPSIQVTRYNATTTPYSLTRQTGLLKYDTAMGKYLGVKVSENIQNSTGDIISGALVQIFYTESDLDRTGDGDANDKGDFNATTLCLYFFDETSGQWIKLSKDLDWVIATGVNTTDIEVYGKKYAGYVWAYVSHLSLFAVAGQTYNQPPDVSNARPSIEYLWPPNHKFVNVTIEGVTDPDGDPITITVLNITSDEPTNSTHADAYGIGTDTAHLRAERLGNGDGRVYVITFLASDGKGGETIGSVKVYVAHDMRDHEQELPATEVNYAQEV